MVEERAIVISDEDQREGGMKIGIAREGGLEMGV